MDLLPFIAPGATVLASGTVAFIALKYNRAQLGWKKHDFFITANQRMNSNPGSRNALLLLTFAEREIELFPKVFTVVGENEAAKALLPNRVFPFERIEQSDTDRHTTPYSPTRRMALHDSFVDLLGQINFVRLAETSELLSHKDAKHLLKMLDVIFDGPRFQRESNCSGLLAATMRLLILDQNPELANYLKWTHGYDIGQRLKADIERIGTLFDIDALKLTSGLPRLLTRKVGTS